MLQGFLQGITSCMPKGFPRFTAQGEFWTLPSGFSNCSHGDMWVGVYAKSAVNWHYSPLQLGLSFYPKAWEVMQIIILL